MDNTAPLSKLQYDPDAKPIWEVAQDLFKNIPEEEFSKIPKDGSVEHDHYIYGTPKRSL